MLANIANSIVIVEAVILLLVWFIDSTLCIIDVAVTDSFSKGTKIRWILFLSTVWCVSGIIYGLFGTRSRWHRALTIALLILVPGGFATAYFMNPAIFTPTPPAAVVKARPAKKVVKAKAASGVKIHRLKVVTP